MEWAASMGGKVPEYGGRYYSTKDLAEMFGVNDSTIKRWSDSGRLKCFKTLGGHRRYTADRILEFIDTYKYSVETSLADFDRGRQINGGNMNDISLLKKDYHMLREVCFADSLKGDTNSLTLLLMNCSSMAEIPPTVIFDEIVLKTIDKIKNLGRQQKLNPEQQVVAVNSILESFTRMKKFLGISIQG